MADKAANDGKTSKFFIDDILNPSFGRAKKTLPSNMAESCFEPTGHDQYLDRKFPFLEHGFDMNSQPEEESEDMSYSDEDGSDKDISCISRSPSDDNNVEDCRKQQHSIMPNLLSFQLPSRQLQKVFTNDNPFIVHYGLTSGAFVNYANPLFQLLPGLYAKCYFNYMNKELDLLHGTLLLERQRKPELSCDTSIMAEAYRAEVALKEETGLNKVNFKSRLNPHGLDDRSRPVDDTPGKVIGINSCSVELSKGCLAEVDNGQNVRNLSSDHKTNFTIDKEDIKNCQSPIATRDDSTKSKNYPSRVIQGPQPSKRSLKEQDLSKQPAWVFCTRYSDRPSSGPRYRKPRVKNQTEKDKRPRTAFSNQQLQRLKVEFESCQYLSEKRRRDLSAALNLSESQVKIWFQNKRAKLKKRSGNKTNLALRLMEEGLYNHGTILTDGNSDTEMNL